MSNYYLGQGKLFAARRATNGQALAMRWLGDVSEAKLGLKTDTVEHKESYSGQRATAKKITIGKEATFDFTLQELTQENLALVLFGTASTIASGSITGEVLPAGLLAGDRVALKYPKVSNVVITDSATTPATLAADKYEVDATYGAITINDVSGMTQPLKAAYEHAALDNVSLFSSINPDIFVRYEGVNLAEEGAPIVVELYKLSTEPLKELSLINTKMQDTAVSAAVLIDSSRPADTEIGQFGRILRPAAV